MSFRCTWLTCWLLFSPYSVANAADSFDPDQTPFSNFYIHALLAQTRSMYALLGTLPESIRPTLLQLAIVKNEQSFKIPLRFAWYFPWLAVTGYSAPHPKKGNDLGPALVETLLDSASINIILGNIYKFPVYVRIGYDFLPLGRHYSEVIDPANMVTRFFYTKGKIIGVGFDVTRTSHQQWSISYTYMTDRVHLGQPQTPTVNIDNSNVAQSMTHKMLSPKLCKSHTVNIQYWKGSPTLFYRWLTVHYMNLGGGISYEDNFLHFNANSDIGVSKHVKHRFECTYYPALRKFSLFNEFHPSRKAVTLSTALHTEVSWHFDNIFLIKWPISAAIVGGYESGLRRIPSTHYMGCDNELTVANNLFLAGKLLWTHRITLILGSKWSFYYKKPQLLATLNIKLL
jgi:hypothetical protein